MYVIVRDVRDASGSQQIVGVSCSDMVKTEPVMPKISTKPLKQNPFLTYRDPVTGRWVVVQNAEAEAPVPLQSPMTILHHPSERAIVPTLAETALAGAAK